MSQVQKLTAASSQQLFSVFQVIVLVIWPITLLFRVVKRQKKVSYSRLKKSQELLLLHVN